MKFNLFSLFLLILFSLGSSRDYISNPSEYFAVLMERPELEASVKFLDPQVIADPGKIYYKDQFIYLNEKYKGVHVINNSNPANPVNIGFINIPGCIDIAIKNNSLLADNATDLVAISINNLEQLAVTKRIQNVFPESTPPDLNYIPYMFTPANRPGNTIIVGWKKLEN
jgi:hypothetical protein